MSTTKTVFSHATLCCMLFFCAIFILLWFNLLYQHEHVATYVYFNHPISNFPYICLVLEMLPYPLLPPWSTSLPQLWHALGPWSGSRASNNRSLTSPLQVLMTHQSPPKVWASCTQAQEVGAIVEAHAGSGEVLLEHLGTGEQGQASRGQILAAGITWWSRSATEGWMSSPSCEFHEIFYFF